jgi:hypothetical protein
MSTQQLTLRLLLLGCLSSSALVEAKKNLLERFEQTTVGSYVIPTSVATLIAGALLLHTRESKPDAAPRYDMWKFANLNLALSHPKDYAKNMWYLFYDGVIGQRQKIKCMKVTEEGTIKQSKACPAFGALGFVDAHLDSVDKTTKMLTNLFVLWMLVDGKETFKAIKGHVFKHKTATDKPGTPKVDAATAFFILKQEGLSEQEIAEYLKTHYNFVVPSTTPA